MVGSGHNSSYAYQCVAAPAGVSGLELAAGVCVAVSAEIRLPVDRARAMSSRISTRFGPSMAPKIAGPGLSAVRHILGGEVIEGTITTEFYD